MNSNFTFPDPPEQLNIAEYFLDRRIDEGLGDHVAIYGHNGPSLTYKDVQNASNRLANVFRDRGLEMENRVLIALPDCHEFVIAWFATLKCGAVFTMVNPRATDADLEYTLSYTRAKILITNYDIFVRVMRNFHQDKQTSCHLRHVLVVGEQVSGEQSYSDAIRHATPTFTNAVTHRDDVAGWLFTSGSTGHPKAAVHLHHDFVFNTERYAKYVLGINPRDRTLSVPRLYFGYATGTNLMFPFSVGASTVLFDAHPTADLMFSLIEQYRPTILTAVPTMIAAMLAVPGAENYDLSSLRACLSAGEALPEELYRRWMNTFGVEILDGIGSAEMFHIYITNYPGQSIPGSVGKIVPGYKTRIVGPDGQDVEPGMIGTLWVNGDSAAVCYWHDHERSKQCLRGDWVVTSDQFQLDNDGNYRYCGRLDDMLKVGGIFVSPVEIENCLHEHVAVAECAVVGYSEAGLTKPMAVVVVRDGVTPGSELAEQLQAFVRSRLAPYKYPRKVLFVASLPKNDRGKLDRKTLSSIANSLDLSYQIHG